MHIIEKISEQLEEIINLFKLQAILKKEILDLPDAAIYANISKDFLYKLTSTNKISHYCPSGKKIYFKKNDIDNWMLQNPQLAREEVQKIAEEYISKTKK